MLREAGRQLAAMHSAGVAHPDVNLRNLLVAEREGVADDGYRVTFNTGEHAGQTVFHVHAHVLGGEPLGPEARPRR
jgi:tRNA A-37 threonylcarbamoyl transferase component Bud32